MKTAVDRTTAQAGRGHLRGMRAAPGLVGLQRLVGNAATAKAVQHWSSSALANRTTRVSAQRTVAPPPSGGTLLRVGSNGPLVQEVQETLNELGADPELDADGIFGPMTRAAVERFQASRDLVADGIVGPQTMAALDQGEPAEADTAPDEDQALLGLPDAGQQSPQQAPVGPGADPVSNLLADVGDGQNNCGYEPGERDASHSTVGPVFPRVGFGSPDNGGVVQQFLFTNYGSGDFQLKGAEHLGSLRPIIQAFGLGSLNPTHRVQLLEGYTDCVSGFDVNVPLRRSRAASLKLALLQNGATGSNLSEPVAGQFGTEPASNRSRSGRALNRSVRMVIERIGKPAPKPNPEFPCTDDPCECPSDEWELTGLGGFEFVIGLGVFVSHFILRNVKQGCCYDLNFQGFGGGIGVGLSLDDFIFSDPARFKTAPNVTITDFRDAKATVESLSAGFVIGVEDATIDFTRINTKPQKIDIGGFTLSGKGFGGGAINAKGSCTVFNDRRCG